jgi:hypothetical protein
MIPLGGDGATARRGSVLRPFHQFGQFGDVCRDPPRLIAREQIRGRSATRLVLIIDVAQRLPVDDEARAVVLDIPGWREAAGLASLGIWRRRALPQVLRHQGPRSRLRGPWPANTAASSAAPATWRYLAATRRASTQGAGICLRKLTPNEAHPANHRLEQYIPAECHHERSV